MNLASTYPFFLGYLIWSFFWALPLVAARAQPGRQNRGGVPVSS